SRNPPTERLPSNRMKAARCPGVRRDERSFNTCWAAFVCTRIMASSMLGRQVWQQKCFRSQLILAGKKTKAPNRELSGKKYFEGAFPGPCRRSQRLANCCQVSITLSGLSEIDSIP